MAGPRYAPLQGTRLPGLGACRRAGAALGAVGVLLCLLPLWGRAGPRPRGRAVVAGGAAPQVKVQMLPPDGGDGGLVRDPGAPRKEVMMDLGGVEVDDGLIAAGLGALAVGGVLAAKQAGMLDGWPDLPGWPALPGAQGGSDRPVNYAHYGPVATPTEDVQADFVWRDVPRPGEALQVGVFASMQFGLEAGGGGYMGMQVASSGASDIFGLEVDGQNTETAIFSYWDLDPSNKVSFLGPQCSRFGGEGTGSHCKIPYRFSEGGKYTISVRVYGYDQRYAALVGDIVDAATGESTAIGTLLVPHAKGLQGFGRFKEAGGSFLEYFSGSGCDNQARSSVGIVGPFFGERSQVPSTAAAAYGKGCRWSDTSACIEGEGCGAPHILFTAGGTTGRTTEDGQELWAAAAPEAVAAPAPAAPAPAAAPAPPAPVPAAEVPQAAGPAAAAEGEAGAAGGAADHGPSLLGPLLPVDGGESEGGSDRAAEAPAASPAPAPLYQGPWKFAQLPERYQQQVRKTG